MKRHKVIRLSIGALLCAFSLASAAQDTSWEMYMQAPTRAYQQGDFGEAEEQLSAALKKAEDFGPEDPRLAANFNNLGVLYYAQGKYTEAEPLHKRALAIRQKVLGPMHPEVAQSLNNLAGLYDAQGKYAEAEALYRRCLIIREMALGESHPEVAKTLENYAELLRKTNRHAEAAKMETRAKAIRDKQQ